MTAEQIEDNGYAIYRRHDDGSRGLRLAQNMSAAQVINFLSSFAGGDQSAMDMVIVVQQYDDNEVPSRRFVAAVPMRVADPDEVLIAFSIDEVKALNMVLELASALDAGQLGSDRYVYTRFLKAFNKIREAVRDAGA